MNQDDVNTLQQVLSKKNNAVVGLNRAGKAPQLTVVWYAWDGEYFIFSTTTDRSKYPNVQRDPAISLLVDDAELGYVAAYGQAEILTDNFAEIARPLVEKYFPNVERGMEMITQPGRILVRLRPNKLLTHFR